MRSDPRPASIADIAQRSSAGAQPFDFAVSEFLDRWQSMTDADRQLAIDTEPVHAGIVHDAFIAALAEHLAGARRLNVPVWTERPERFLTTPFFAGGMESLKAILLVESPSAFRRRLIFISADGLSRPQRNGTTTPADAAHQ